MTEQYIIDKFNEIKQLSKSQDDIFNEIIEKLELKDESDTEDWVFDYLFNSETPQNLIKFLQGCGKITN